MEKASPDSKASARRRNLATKSFLGGIDLFHVSLLLLSLTSIICHLHHKRHIDSERSAKHPYRNHRSWLNCVTPTLNRDSRRSTPLRVMFESLLCCSIFVKLFIIFSRFCFFFAFSFGDGSIVDAITTVVLAKWADSGRIEATLLVIGGNDGRVSRLRIHPRAAHRRCTANTRFAMASGAKRSPSQQGDRPESLSYTVQPSFSKIGRGISYRRYLSAVCGPPSVRRDRFAAHGGSSWREGRYLGSAISSTINTKPSRAMTRTLRPAGIGL